MPTIRCVGTTDQQTPCRLQVKTTEPLPLCRDHFISTGLKQYKEWCQLGPDDLGFVGALRDVAWHRLTSAASHYTAIDDASLTEASCTFLVAEKSKVKRVVRRGLPKKGTKVVYFIRIADLVKIGKTDDLRERLTTFSYPRIELLATEPGYTKLEKELHRRFHLYRESGEWFRYGPALRDYVESLQARCAIEALAGSTA